MFKKAPIYPGIQASNELSGQMPFHWKSYCSLHDLEATFFSTEASASCCWAVENKGGEGKKGLIEPQHFTFLEPK